MAEIPKEGVIIRAENGDVIRYDETGLVLRLSDKVIADIAARLELKPAVVGEVLPLPELPDDVDLWAARREGDWRVGHGRGLCPNPLPERKPQTEPPQLGMKRIIVKAQAQLPYIAMALVVMAQDSGEC